MGTKCEESAVCNDCKCRTHNWIRTSGGIILCSDCLVNKNIDPRFEILIDGEVEACFIQEHIRDACWSTIKQMYPEKIITTRNLRPFKQSVKVSLIPQ